MANDFMPSSMKQVAQVPEAETGSEFMPTSLRKPDTASGFTNVPVGFEDVGESIPSAPQRNAARQQRLGASGLDRILGAAKKPFEGETGLSQETQDSLVGNIPVLKDLNRLAVRYGMQPVAAILDSAAKGVQGGIAAAVQAASEAGIIPQHEVNSATREFNALAEVAGLFGGRPITQTRGLPSKSQLSQVTDPAMAARQVNQANLPVKVPLSRGDLTQNVDIQARQDRAAKGLEGQQAQGLVEGFEESQDVALRGNVEALQEQATGRVAATAEEAGLGAQSAASELKGAAKESRELIGEAYEKARSLDASVDGEALKSLSPSIRSRLSNNGFDVAEMPRLGKRLDELEGLKLKDGKVTPATLNNIEILRKRIVKNIESVKLSDPSEAQALRSVRNDLDDHIDQSLDMGLVNGNTEAVEAWKNARGLRQKFSKDFTEQKTIKKIVEDDLTSEQTLNYLFGGSQMGFKADAGNNIRHIKRVLGEDSDAIKSLKEEAILRLVKNQSDSTSFSGAKFNTAFEKAMKNNKTLMNELFNAAEIDDLRNLARVARSVTVKKAGATNPSGTFINLARTGGHLTKIPFAGDIIAGLLKIGTETKKARQIEGDLTVADEIIKLRKDPTVLRQAVAATMIQEDEQ